jgi:hypothetical protein
MYAKIHLSFCLELLLKRPGVKSPAANSKAQIYVVKPRAISVGC